MPPESPAPAKKKKKRRRNAVPESAYRRIKDAPQFREIHQKLCAGVSCESLAKWLRDDCGYGRDIAEGSLVRQLYRYKSTIPPVEFAPKAANKLKERIQGFSHQIDNLQEMIYLCELQQTRLHKLIELEDRANMGVIAQLGTEMDRYVRYLDNLVDLKVRLGLIKPGIGELAREQAAGLAEGMSAGIMALLAKKHGPEAHERLSHIGKKLSEAMQRMATAESHLLAGGSAPALPAAAPAEPLPLPKLSGLDPALEIKPTS